MYSEFLTIGALRWDWKHWCCGTPQRERERDTGVTIARRILRWHDIMFVEGGGMSNNTYWGPETLQARWLCRAQDLEREFSHTRDNTVPKAYSLKHGEIEETVGMY